MPCHNKHKTHNYCKQLKIIGETIISFILIVTTNNKFTTQITTNNSNYYKQLKITHKQQHKTHKQQHLNIFNTTSSFKPSSIALVPNFLPLQAFKITIQSNPIMTTTARTSILWQNFSFFFKSSSCFSFTLSFFLSSSILFINDKITSFARP